MIERILKEGVSLTFHGRDLFAPLAGYILGGHPLVDVMRKKDSLVKLRVMKPVEDEKKISGKIIYIDRFGNLITNIQSGLVSRQKEIYLKTGESLTSIGTLKKTYSSVEEGVFLPVIGSRGFLEIAVNRGSAENYFDARCGDDILIFK